jgi:hypothetical protein
LKASKAETLPSEVAKASRAKESGKGTTDHGLQDYGEKAFPIKLLKQLLDSTVELQAALEHFLKGQPLPDKDLEGSISPPKRPEMKAEGRMQNAECRIRRRGGLCVPVDGAGLEGGFRRGRAVLSGGHAGREVRELPGTSSERADLGV